MEDIILFVGVGISVAQRQAAQPFIQSIIESVTV